MAIMIAAIGFMFANNALYFDGVDDVVKFPNPGATNIVSMEAWFKPSTLKLGTLGSTIFAASPTNLKTLWLTQYGSELRLWAFGSDNNALHFQTTGANLQVGQWYHVAVTAQRGAANRTKLYLNGVLMID